jgi:hypothetical protein
VLCDGEQIVVRRALLWFGEHAEVGEVHGGDVRCGVDAAS